MALKVVSMEELKLQVLLEPERSGESVAAVCVPRVGCVYSVLVWSGWPDP